MRTVTVHPPSFPEVRRQHPVEVRPDIEWQVLCGDTGHWRLGVFSPAATSRDACDVLERHTCPELFILIEGRLTLVVSESGGVRELELVPGRPVLIDAPHAGFCPGGAHTGKAWVVERDRFATEYRASADWQAPGD